MAAAAVQASVEPDQAPVNAVLDVLLLYEDLGTALRATQSLDRLSRRLGSGAKFRARVWRLDLLDEPLLVEQAAIEAAAADVIILSLHDHHELPAAASSCLTRWLVLKADRPYALAALLDPEPNRPDSDSPVLACLKRITKIAHADLFCGSCPAR